MAFFLSKHLWISHTIYILDLGGVILKNFLYKMKIKKKKKGLTAIETIIGALIFLIAFVGICDLLLISNRYLSLTDTAKEMARTISVQGGALKVKPAAYTSNYYNVEELSKILERQMETMGFSKGEYALYVTYEKTYDEDANRVVETTATDKILGTKDDGTYGVIQPTKKIAYLSDFSVSIVAQYNWPFISSIRKIRPAVLRVSMPGVSEWRYGYDGWSQEG